MADRYELAYVHARVAGSLAKSLAGGRAAELLRIGRLEDAWRAAFGDAPPSLPEARLVAAAEARALRKAQADFVRLAEGLRRDEPFFDALRRKSEFARVKRVLLAVRRGEAACPEALDPGLAPGFDEHAFPSLPGMFAGGRYGWIDDACLADLPAAENRLDCQFYRELWAALDSVPRRHEGGLHCLVALEVELENVIWALRLARYFGLDLSAIRKLLVDLPGRDVISAALDGAARAGAAPGADAPPSAASGRPRAARAPSDSGRKPGYEGWKFAFLVQNPSATRSPDPRDIERAARGYLYRELKRSLHRAPFSYAPLYCYFKLKEFETAVILGLVEGIHLGAPAAEIAALAPVGGSL